MSEAEDVEEQTPTLTFQEADSRRSQRKKRLFQPKTWSEGGRREQTFVYPSISMSSVCAASLESEGGGISLGGAAAPPLSSVSVYPRLFVMRRHECNRDDGHRKRPLEERVVPALLTDS